MTIHAYYNPDAPSPYEATEPFGQLWLWGRYIDTNISSPPIDEFARPNNPPECDRKRLDVDAMLWEWLHGEWWDRDFPEDEPLAYVPVWAYIHGGVALSLKPFSCPWDSGLAGCAWASREQVKYDFDGSVERAEQLLRAQVRELGEWYRGEVYRIDMREVEAVGDWIDWCYGREEVKRVVDEILGVGVEIEYHNEEYEEDK